MNRSRKFFLILLFFAMSPAFANLRAPWSINRYPAYSIPKVNELLVVLKEELVFHCDKVYKGDGDLSQLKEKKCQVEVVYFIQSNKNVTHTIDFVLPSEEPVSIYFNNSLLENTPSNIISLSDLEKEGYRLSDLCRYCNETINQLYSVPFISKFQTGINTIRIIYKQPLSASEFSYGYFQSSKWIHGFAYELWPLKGWKLDKDFQLKVKFTTEVGGFFQRMFNRKVLISCNGLDLRYSKNPNIPSKKNIESEKYDDFYKYNQNLNPQYNLTNSSKSYIENNKLVYELNLKEMFPDRLNCYFGDEK